MPPTIPQADIRTVKLTEWAQVGPDEFPELADQSLADSVSANPIVEQLRSRIDIRRTRKGLQIASTSFVGRIDIGRLRVAILPKLTAMPLACLLRYAYTLRNLSVVSETSGPTAHGGLQDLLTRLLADEVEELLLRGLARRYVALLDSPESPRGRILLSEVARRGGINEPRLPCRYFERHLNWHLNQTLRAGLVAAGQMTEDFELRRRVYGLVSAFEPIEEKSRLRRQDLDRAERGLTRLTSACASALSIVRLLHDMRGLGFDAREEDSRTPDFLFDMNLFFQRLLSRFLHEHLSSDRVLDEWPIHSVFAYAPQANPRRQAAPAPRPDLALVTGNTIRAFLDAKYRDIWEQGFPIEWLYQLSVYALASPARIAILLYASMSREASEEQIDIRPPMQGLGSGTASVILRPVSLPILAELLQADRNRSEISARSQFAARLVHLHAHRPADGGIVA
jgi:5-methylcytosine-specific restriction enzyme subunit McrC